MLRLFVGDCKCFTSPCRAPACGSAHWHPLASAGAHPSSAGAHPSSASAGACGRSAEERAMSGPASASARGRCWASEGEGPCRWVGLGARRGEERRAGAAGPLDGLEDHLAGDLAGEA